MDPQDQQRIYQRIRAKSLTLAVVNVLQPVKKTVLTKQLKSTIGIAQINDVLDELIKENKVTKEKWRYRLTSHGMQSIIPDEGRVLRDVQRMKYLAQVTRQRGGR